MELDEPLFGISDTNISNSPPGSPEQSHPQIVREHPSFLVRTQFPSPSATVTAPGTVSLTPRLCDHISLCSGSIVIVFGPLVAAWRLSGSK